MLVSVTKLNIFLLLLQRPVFSAKMVLNFLKGKSWCSQTSAVANWYWKVLTNTRYKCIGSSLRRRVSANSCMFYCCFPNKQLNLWHVQIQIEHLTCFKQPRMPQGKTTVWLFSEQPFKFNFGKTEKSLFFFIVRYPWNVILRKWQQLFERTWSEIVWEVTGETIVAASRADRTSQQHFEEEEMRKDFQVAWETVGEWAYLVQTLLFQEEN